MDDLIDEQEQDSKPKNDNKKPGSKAAPTLAQGEDFAKTVIDGTITRVLTTITTVIIEFVTRSVAQLYLAVSRPANVIQFGLGKTPPDWEEQIDELLHGSTGSSTWLEKLGLSDTIQNQMHQTSKLLSNYLILSYDHSCISPYIKISYMCCLRARAVRHARFIVL